MIPPLLSCCLLPVLAQLLNPSASPPFKFDVMRTYLATSRDGIHFDTSWVYAQQELIPHGSCAPLGAPYCMPLSEIDEVMSGSGGAPIDEACCGFDHGITIPASALLSLRGEHRLYYEGRVAPHESRYAPNYPMAVGVATWRQHRMVGVRADPAIAANGTCGVVTTKALDLGAISATAADSGSRWSFLRTPRRAKSGGGDGPVHITVNVGFPDGPHRADSALYAELVHGCDAEAEAEAGASGQQRTRGTPGRTLRAYSLERSIPITSDSSAAVLQWQRPGGAPGAAGSPSVVSTVQASSRALSLRFVICGDAKLFAFSVWAGEAREDAAGASPAATTPHTATARATTSATDGAGGAVADPPALHDLLAARQSLRQRRWEVRAAEMRSHAISYGRCSRDMLPTQSLVDMPAMGYDNWREAPACGGMPPLACTYSLSTPPDIMAAQVDTWLREGSLEEAGSDTAQDDDPSETMRRAPPTASNTSEAYKVASLTRTINGVDGCRQLCRARCLSCEWASLSWSSFKCTCFEKCDVQKLAYSQLSDDVDPSFMIGKPTVPVRGGGVDPLFDWVSFAIEDDPLPADARRARDGAPLSAFPRQLWNTTSEWTTDWLNYTKELEAAGVEHCIPSWMCSDTPAGKIRGERSRNRQALKQRGGNADSDSNRLSMVAMKELRGSAPFSAGFCAVTSIGGNCARDALGAWSLKQLMGKRAKTWRTAVDVCRKKCMSCGNCNFVSMSIAADDCSWYQQCEFKHLNTQFDGFYSMRVKGRVVPTRPSDGRSNTSKRHHLSRLNRDRLPRPGNSCRDPRFCRPPAKEQSLATMVAAGAAKAAEKAKSFVRRDLPSLAAVMDGDGRQLAATAARRSSLLAYLVAVYPHAAVALRNLSTAALAERFESLDYLYTCDVAGLRPSAPSVELPCPPLPYLPAGAYYSTGGAHVGPLHTFNGGNFFRYPEPIELHAAGPMPRVHSSYGGRAGPAPAWTSPLATVRYPLFPLGMARRAHTGGRMWTSTRGWQDAAAATKGRLTNATIADAQAADVPTLTRPARATVERGRAYSRLRTHPRVAAALVLSHGDVVEVEQWGGVLGADACPPICGLWANMWRGTGVGMRLFHPFVSLNKATAIIEMIMQLGAKDSQRLVQLAAALDLASPEALAIRRAHPTASYSACLAAALLRQHPCRGTGDAQRFAPLVDRWLALTNGLSPEELVAEFLHLTDATRLPSSGGARAHHNHDADSARGDTEASVGRLGSLSEMERFAIFWLWGACGIGTFGMDRLLVSLACALGHGSVVLAASSNDNGLVHQEVVDFELPQDIGWAAGAKPPPSVSMCADPFAWVQKDRSAGEHAEARRRKKLLSFWEGVGKFQLPAAPPEPNAAAVVVAAGAETPRHAQSSPCALRFGGRASHVEGRVQACRYHFPQGTATPAALNKDCYAWCENTLSAAHAQVSLLHSRLPSCVTTPALDADDDACRVQDRMG